VRSAPPSIGQHSAALLRELGDVDDEIDGLLRERVVGEPKP
jgi:crotonobetainyl-CoA:carnitine CoA-transferase CaiB-like acyl-CoA transferase